MERFGEKDKPGHVMGLRLFFFSRDGNELTVQSPTLKISTDSRGQCNH